MSTTTTDDNNNPLPTSEDIPSPHTDLNAVEVTRLCMDALQHRSPKQSLEICFNFSNDRCRAAVGGSLEEFIQYASNPIFGSLINCKGYDLVSIGNVIAGGPHRGAMQTILVEIQQGDDDALPADSQGSEQKQQQQKQLTARERRQLRQQQEQQSSEEQFLEQQEGKGNKKKKKFLWTLQKERRPPRQDCWLVHEVLFIKNAFALTL